MIDIKDKNKNMCCGCTACASICPQKAIIMKEDFEGFKYPIVDKERCIDCGLCDKVCPFISKANKKTTIREAYVVQNKNEEVLMTSTSGGFVSAVGEYIVDNKGYMCGAAFNENFEIVHKLTNDKKELKEFRGSKYAQSELEGIFIETKEKLDNKFLVGFCGTPCQIMGLKKYLGKNYENLITIDFVCRSVVSPKFWKKYKTLLEEKYDSNIRNVNFRHKTYGYHSGSMLVEFENGKIYSGSNRIDLYNKAFHSDKCSRYSCYNCPAKGIDRLSDFTVFDSWEPTKLNKDISDNDKGFTNLIIHTKKGKDLFEKNLKKDFYSYRIDVNECGKYTGGMLETSIDISKREKNFYGDIFKRNVRY